MSWSRPEGYRVPGTMSLPLMSWALEEHAWPAWRAEAVQALAAVADELDASPDRDATLRRISSGQVGEEDLVMSRAQQGGLLLRAGEFLDVAHAVMHRPSAVPLPATLDLRCTCQFMDDPTDSESAWIYVLLGTEQRSMERMFAALPVVEPYPVPTEGDDDSEEVRDRAAVWQRVLARYSTFSPPSIVAPEPHLAFDLVEAIGADDRSAGGRGKISVSEVVEEIEQRRGGVDEGLRSRLLAPIDA